MPIEAIVDTLLYSRSATFDGANNLDWLLVTAQTDTKNNKHGIGLASLQEQLQRVTANTPEPSLSKVTKLTNTNAVLILPAEITLIKALAIPSNKLQHIQAAVPHLIEEWTASELEDLHIALGDRSIAGSVPVIAIDRHILQRWLASAEATPLRIDRVFIDALLLPYSAQTLTLVLDGERALLRWSEQQAGAIEIHALEPVLTALLNREDIQTISVFTSPIADQRHVTILQEMLPLLVRRFTSTIEYHHIEGPLLEFFSTQLTGLKKSAPVNLRQGEFKTGDGNYLKWRRWRPVAVVAAICVVLQIVVNIILGITLNHQAESLHTQSENLYRQLFPQDKRLVNLLQQTRSHLDASSLNGHASFAVLFSHLATAIQTVSSKHPPQLHALQYDATTGALQVEVVLDTVQTLDDLKSRLGAEGVNTKVLSAANENGALVGRLSLTGT